ncbi:cytochrome b562 [Vibrio cincinnatiensis]|uniref:cytochrome b562 n=1 Tax=Vibrio cincinnatiensis TaxID=675 RepID=UPI001EE0AB5D|nr:cytochrome b562 [Vibrio cincinnatiensis]MCG3728839.1 cytochrome b562 family protein [Vibrio cincinnatiensis]
MKKRLLLSAGLLFAVGQGFAADMDMKQLMQQMKLEFKSAAEAQSVEAMQEPITQLSWLVAQAKQAPYPPERADIYQEGFNKLTVTLNKATNELASGEFDAAKLTLKEVDELRIEYHEKKKPSLWQRLFG